MTNDKDPLWEIVVGTLLLLILISMLIYKVIIAMQ